MQYKNLFICPDCHQILRENPPANTLVCPKCNFEYKIENGLYYLHANNAAWQKCEVEKRGWIETQKELGIYCDNNDHYYLPDLRPHLKAFYAEAKKSIDKMLEVENFKQKLCLDVGAGIGWVECYILKRINTEIIAIDCNDDKYVGLGRAEALKKHHKCDFLTVIGDMHNIPIADNSIDIVFMVDALHHFSDLKKVLAEAYRVLKPGGHFWAINEAQRPGYIPGFVAAGVNYIKGNPLMESKHGVTERRPTIKEYLKAGEILKLQVLNKQLGFVTRGLMLYGEK